MLKTHHCTSYTQRSPSRSPQSIGLRHDHRTVFCSFPRLLTSWLRCHTEQTFFSYWVSLAHGVTELEGKMTVYFVLQPPDSFNSQSNYILLWWRNFEIRGGLRAQVKKTHTRFHFRHLEASELTHIKNLSLTTITKKKYMFIRLQGCSWQIKSIPLKITFTKTLNSEATLINLLWGMWDYYSSVNKIVDCFRLKKNIHIWRKLPNRLSLVGRSWVGLWLWKGKFSLCWPTVHCLRMDVRKRSYLLHPGLFCGSTAWTQRRMGHSRPLPPSCRYLGESPYGLSKLLARVLPMLLFVHDALSISKASQWPIWRLKTRDSKSKGLFERIFIWGEMLLPHFLMKLFILRTNSMMLWNTGTLWNG